VPPLRRMPRPPSELLVAVPVVTYRNSPGASLKRAVLLPSNPAYATTAAEMDSGKAAGREELEWYASAVDHSVARVRKALPPGAGGWPKGPGGPELLPAEDHGLGCAHCVSAAYNMVQGRDTEAVALCVDGLRLAAYVQAGAGPEADAAAAAAERPILTQVHRLLASGALAPSNLTVVLCARPVSGPRPVSGASSEGGVVHRRGGAEDDVSGGMGRRGAQHLADPAPCRPGGGVEPRVGACGRR